MDLSSGLSDTVQKKLNNDTGTLEQQNSSNLISPNFPNIPVECSLVDKHATARFLSENQSMNAPGLSNASSETMDEKKGPQESADNAISRRVIKKGRRRSVKLQPPTPALNSQASEEPVDIENVSPHPPSGSELPLFQRLQQHLTQLGRSLLSTSGDSASQSEQVNSSKDEGKLIPKGNIVSLERNEAKTDTNQSPSCGHQESGETCANLTSPNVSRLSLSPAYPSARKTPGFKNLMESQGVGASPAFVMEIQSPVYSPAISGNILESPSLPHGNQQFSTENGGRFLIPIVSDVDLLAGSFNASAQSENNDFNQAILADSSMESIGMSLSPSTDAMTALPKKSETCELTSPRLTSATEIQREIVETLTVHPIDSDASKSEESELPAPPKTDTVFCEHLEQNGSEISELPSNESELATKSEFQHDKATEKTSEMEENLQESEPDATNAEVVAQSNTEDIFEDVNEVTVAGEATTKPLQIDGKLKEPEYDAHDIEVSARSETEDISEVINKVTVAETFVEEIALPISSEPMDGQTEKRPKQTRKTKRGRRSNSAVDLAVPNEIVSEIDGKIPKDDFLKGDKAKTARKSKKRGRRSVSAAELDIPDRPASSGIDPSQEMADLAPPGGEYQNEDDVPRQRKRGRRSVCAADLPAPNCSLPGEDLHLDQLASKTAPPSGHSQIEVRASRRTRSTRKKGRRSLSAFDLPKFEDSKIVSEHEAVTCSVTASENQIPKIRTDDNDDLKCATEIQGNHTEAVLPEMAEKAPHLSIDTESKPTKKGRGKKGPKVPPVSAPSTSTLPEIVPPRTNSGGIFDDLSIMFGDEVVESKDEPNVMEDVTIMFEDQENVQDVDAMSGKVEAKGRGKRRKRGGTRRKSRMSMDFIGLEQEESDVVQNKMGATFTPKPVALESQEETVRQPSAPPSRKKLRNRRRSADFFIINASNIVNSPDPTDDDSLLRHVPPSSVRRSSRIRRKSIELCRQQMAEAVGEREPAPEPPQLEESYVKEMPPSGEMTNESEISTSVTISNTECAKCESTVSEPQAEVCDDPVMDVVVEEVKAVVEEESKLDTSSDTSFSSTEAENLLLCQENITTFDLDSAPSIDSVVEQSPEGRPRRKAAERANLINSAFAAATAADSPRGRGKRKKEASIEEIYLNKNFSMPLEKAWETIYEAPKVAKGAEVLHSKQRLKRKVDFEDFWLQSRMKRRRQRARQIGWRPTTKKAAEKAMQRLDDSLLDLDAAIMSMDDTTDSRKFFNLPPQARLWSLGEMPETDVPESGLRDTDVATTVPQSSLASSGGQDQSSQRPSTGEECNQQINALKTTQSDENETDIFYTPMKFKENDQTRVQRDGDVMAFSEEFCTPAKGNSDTLGCVPYVS